ncbi:hypothetical protein GCM10010259_61830 [Streptomyces daghestanicus]|uniref:Uncharacterized protein n=1 Tax=Streptomyces daghestanicus TaxID=66885 RepID=A0ABQ3PVR4_9ACTN|nr:hypothetical protein GCM10010259_61830 [Streptomyces daghestanicus]GHI29106.1 hypothetical protein Sdagh_08360 [Streptomyces daghestanicus]
MGSFDKCGTVGPAAAGPGGGTGTGRRCGAGRSRTITAVHPAPAACGGSRGEATGRGFRPYGDRPPYGHTRLPGRGRMTGVPVHRRPAPRPSTGGPSAVRGDAFLAAKVMGWAEFSGIIAHCYLHSQ